MQPHDEEAGRGPSVFRKRVILFFFVAIPAMQLFDMVTERQDFPFGPFLMYSSRQRAAESQRELQVVREGRRDPANSACLVPLQIWQINDNLNSTIQDSVITSQKLSALAELYRLRARGNSQCGEISELVFLKGGGQ